MKVFCYRPTAIYQSILCNEFISVT